MEREDTEAHSVALLAYMSSHLFMVDVGLVKYLVATATPTALSHLVGAIATAAESDFVNSDLLPSARVPRGHIFLQGDNPMASTDSRHFGPVPLGLVQIRLTLRIWPVSRFGWLSDHWFWESEEDMKRNSKADVPKSKFYPRS